MVATIDALAVGVTFAFLDVSIAPAAAFIGCLTFAISAAGLKIGTVLEQSIETKQSVLGNCPDSDRSENPLEHLGIF